MNKHLSTIFFFIRNQVSIEKATKIILVPNNAKYKVDPFHIYKTYVHVSLFNVWPNNKYNVHNVCEYFLFPLKTQRSGCITTFI